MGNSQSDQQQEQVEEDFTYYDYGYDYYQPKPRNRRRKPRNRSNTHQTQHNTNTGVMGYLDSDQEQEQEEEDFTFYDYVCDYYQPKPRNRRRRPRNRSNTPQTQHNTNTGVMSNSESDQEQDFSYSDYDYHQPKPRNRRKPRNRSNTPQRQYEPSGANVSTPTKQNTHSSNRRQQKTQPSTTSTMAIPAALKSSSHSSSHHQGDREFPKPAAHNGIHHANNYVIPAADDKERKDRWKVSRCQGRRKAYGLRVCPQYNGHGCVTEPCRRLHVCFYWAKNTCRKKLCNYDHSYDSMHNRRLTDTCQEMTLDDSLGKSFMLEELQICPFSVLGKCSRRDCSKIHSIKNYQWQVKGNNVWIEMSCKQSDYLELMYSHPSEEQVDLIPIQTDIGNNKNLQRLADLLSKETSWSVDLENFKLNGTSSMHEIRRLSTSSDLTSRVHAATRWVWYWQDDDGSWEPYLQGVQKNFYHVALSDELEYILRAQDTQLFSIHINEHSYSIDGNKMTQTNTTTGRTRRVRRRPAYSLLCKKSVKFDDLFLIQPTDKKYLKLPLVPLSSEFVFVEGLLEQTLAGLKISSIHRIQNDHLWKVYQNKKRYLISLNNGDTTTLNEQYLFHGTSHEAINHICAENFDWRLYGTNVGHLYGQGTYFTNLAKLAYTYGKSNNKGKKVMLVVLVLVGKTTVGQANMSFPPTNTSTGRRYDTTCDKETNASIFVKYDRDEYYPAYVVKYSCAS